MLPLVVHQNFCMGVSEVNTSGHPVQTNSNPGQLPGRFSDFSFYDFASLFRRASLRDRIAPCTHGLLVPMWGRGARRTVGSTGPSIAVVHQSMAWQIISCALLLLAPTRGSQFEVPNIMVSTSRSNSFSFLTMKRTRSRSSASST